MAPVSPKTAGRWRRIQRERFGLVGGDVRSTTLMLAVTLLCFSVAGLADEPGARELAPMAFMTKMAPLSGFPRHKR